MALLRDFRYAVRQLRKSPGFTVIVVLMLALGIGANTAVFSVMNAILMQLLPVGRPQGLYYVHIGADESQAPGGWNTGNGDTSFTEATFEAFRQRTDVFEDLIAYVPLSESGKVAVRVGDVPEEAEGEEVSGNFFSALGVHLERGRGFSLADETTHQPVAVISYDYWTRRFSRDPGVIGATIYVKGVPISVIGVGARGFKGIEPASSADFWIPLQNRAELNAWGTPADDKTLYGSANWWCLRMMARVRRGVTPQQAQQALAGTFLDAVTQAQGKIDPHQWKPALELVPARGIEGMNVDLREPMRALMALVALVLILACINVVMMLSARNTAREREFSIRMAIGAGRQTIFRQLLCESLLLVGSGALLGWLFAVYATRVLAVWYQVESGLTPDRNVLLFTLAIACAASFLFGLTPLRAVVRTPVAGVLRSSSTGLTAGRSRVLGVRIALSAQVAISLVLLMAAGLLLRTLRNYITEDLGVQSNSLLVFGVTPQTHGDNHLFFRTLLERIREVPGVESVSMAENRPGSGWSSNDLLILDGVLEKGGSLRWNGVGPDFFQTMGVPVLIGRDIGAQDVAGTRRVAVVNQTMVKRYLANTNPIGHQIWSKNPATIVGVIPDIKYRSVDEQPRPMAWVAEMQEPSIGTMHIEVRTRGDGMALLPEMRKLVSEMNPNIPLEAPMTQREQFDESFDQQRVFAAIGGVFGLLAALLVATGLYGMHSFRVSRRTTEIGVRMALGATRAQVLAMVLREAGWVLLAGLAAGIPLTLLAVRPLKSMLYGLSAFDPASLVLAIVAMTLVSTFAALTPARRAASIEPVRALRTE